MDMDSVSYSALIVIIITGYVVVVGVATGISMVRFCMHECLWPSNLMTVTRINRLRGRVTCLNNNRLTNLLNPISIGFRLSWCPCLQRVLGVDLLKRQYAKFKANLHSL